MKSRLILYSLLLTLVHCKPTSSIETSQDNTDLATQFINTFYSFDSDSLKSILDQAKTSQPGILYYQKWAECANYKIAKRNDFITKNDSLIICPITVKDDLMGALNIDFNVTDSFHITIVNKQIVSVQTSSNDLDVYYEARDWVKENQPDLIAVPCIGIWEDGTTPCECVKGMIKGYAAFSNTQK